MHLKWFFFQVGFVPKTKIYLPNISECGGVGGAFPVMRKETKYDILEGFKITFVKYFLIKVYYKKQITNSSILISKQY